MCPAPNSRLAHPQQIIADLRRELEKSRAQRDKAQWKLDERTTERDEALAQQTAIAEVLQVINSSPGNLGAVFDAILEKAHRLCGVAFGALELRDGGKFRSVAQRGLSDPLAELLRQPFEPPPGSPPSRLLGGERIVQITDMAEWATQHPDGARAQVGAEYGDLDNPFAAE